MAFFFDVSKSDRPLARFARSGAAPAWADLMAFLLLAALAVLIVHGAEQVEQPLSHNLTDPPRRRRHANT